MNAARNTTASSMPSSTGSAGERVETGLADPNTLAQLRDVLDKLEHPTAGGAHDAAKVSAAARPPRQKRNRSRTMDTQQGVTAPKANTISFAELLAVATELGTQAGQGKDVQIKFDLKVLEAAFLGGVDLDANKHGTDIDDAQQLSEAYVKAQGTATIFDAKAPNQRRLISNVRKMVKLGMWPKGGQGEPLSTVNSLVSLRQKLRQVPANAKKLDDAHNMLMRYATQQIKRDQIIEGDELRAFCFKAEHGTRTGEEVIEGIRKVLNNLKAGKVSNCPDMDNSQEVQNMINLCTKRLTAIAKAKGGQAPAPSTAAAV